jgi:predicted nucleotidyltransferase
MYYNKLEERFKFIDSEKIIERRQTIDNMNTMSQTEKDRITSLISHKLDSDERVIFAYLYGSFVCGNFFRDIDVFVYIRNDEDTFVTQSSIRDNIYESVINAGFHIGIDDFDVRVINDAPYDFVIDILDKGTLLVDKNRRLRTDYIERISDQYRVNYFILDEAYR